jgi:hypothetical protein
MVDLCRLEAVEYASLPPPQLPQLPLSPSSSSSSSSHVLPQATGSDEITQEPRGPINTSPTSPTTRYLNNVNLNNITDLSQLSHSLKLTPTKSKAANDDDDDDDPDDDLSYLLQQPYLLPPHHRLRNLQTLPKLLLTLLKTGANPTLNILLYLKSLLFGTFPTSNMCLPWIVNEGHNTIHKCVTVGEACLFFLSLGGVSVDGVETLLRYKDLLPKKMHIKQFESEQQQMNSEELVDDDDVVVVVVGEGMNGEGGGGIPSGSSGSGSSGGRGARGVDARSLNNLALLAACRDGRTEVVRVLLKYGAEPTARDGMPLLLARNNERLDVVKVLEEAIRQ